MGASIAPDSDLLLEHVGMNPTRTGVIEILRLMGADIELTNERVVGGEPVAPVPEPAAEGETAGVFPPPRLRTVSVEMRMPAGVSLSEKSLQQTRFAIQKLASMKKSRRSLTPK